MKRVYDDPCHWETSSQSDIDLGFGALHARFDPSPRGVTLPKPPRGGLSNQKGRAASELTKVELGGQDALKVELSVPAGLDLATCDRGELRSWPGWDDNAAGGNAHHSPGQSDVVYIVDLDRAPLVTDASQMPTTSAADRTELEAVLASIVVDRGLGR